MYVFDSDSGRERPHVSQSQRDTSFHLFTKNLQHFLSIRNTHPSGKRDAYNATVPIQCVSVTSLTNPADHLDVINEVSICLRQRQNGQNGSCSQVFALATIGWYADTLDVC